MKNRVSFLMAGLALMGSLLACTLAFNGNPVGQVVRGSGTPGQESRNVSNVSGVELGMDGSMDITIGNRESLTIEADDNLLQYIQTNVSGGRLVVDTRPGIGIQPVRPIKYHLTVIRLDSVAISSSGDVSVPDLKSDNFRIAVSSSGDLSMQKLDCSSLNVDLSSSGDASLSALNAQTLSVNISSSGNVDIGGGQVTQQTIHIGSSGDYNARNLASEKANVDLSSSGDATLSVSSVLSGNLSSSGDINYIGNPQVSVNTSSSGRAIQILQIK